jgi:hypothetical protein
MWIFFNEIYKLVCQKMTYTNIILNKTHIFVSTVSHHCSKDMMNAHSSQLTDHKNKHAVNKRNELCTCCQVDVWCLMSMNKSVHTDWWSAKWFIKQNVVAESFFICNTSTKAEALLDLFVPRHYAIHMQIFLLLGQKHVSTFENNPLTWTFLNTKVVHKVRFPMIFHNEKHVYWHWIIHCWKA